MQFNKLVGASVVVALASLTCAYANNTGWKFTQGKDPNSQFHYRLPAKFHDDITTDQDVAAIKLTKQQKHQALVWNLNVDEEKRYVALVKNRSSYFYPNATPTQMLGFNARNDSERQKYATKDAKQQFQYLAKYLAYVTTYNNAAASLKDSLHLPVIRKFDYAKFSPYNYQPVELLAHDELKLFVEIKDAIKPTMAYLLSAVREDSSIKLTIYFVGGNVSKEQITNWAKAQNIPAELVHNGQITLSLAGKFLPTKKQKTPVLMLIRNNQQQFIDTAKF
ncbi:MAG: hypothetical protein COB50_05445 [Thiotrichales bacterium]|nr:MAG: hypothetical protein COB50_05445 [Thiotrichales bacterium]